MVAFGNFLFRFRNGLFPLVFVALAVSTPVLFRGDEILDHWLDVVGLAIALTGQTLRVVVIGFAYIRRGGKRKKVYADDLVQDGIFAHSRNPLYVGNILVLFGLMVIHNSPLMYAVGLPFFLVAYLAITMAEEDFLARKFGQEYQDYCRRVNRYIPDLRGIRRTLSGTEFDWKKVIRKEYGSTFTWVTAALAILIWQAWANFGYTAEAEEIKILAWCWVPVIVAYLSARILKKRGVLGSG